MKQALAPSVPFTEELSELITRLVKQIPYDYRRQAMQAAWLRLNKKPITAESFIISAWFRG